MFENDETTDLIVTFESKQDGWQGFLDSALEQLQRAQIPPQQRRFPNVRGLSFSNVDLCEGYSVPPRREHDVRRGSATEEPASVAETILLPDLNLAHATLLEQVGAAGDPGSLTHNKAL